MAVAHLDDSGSETSSRRGLAGGVDCAREERGDVLQHLTLCARGVSDDRHVDIATQVDPLGAETPSLFTDFQEVRKFYALVDWFILGFSPHKL